MHVISRLSAVLVLLVTAQAHAAEHVVLQKGKAFSSRALVVQRGDSIKFVNEDSFAHNIFSLSETKSFDLGSHGQGTAKSVVMDKPGMVEVECAVHSSMKMTIEVR
ncbi:MAG: methylamine utilization protein [Ramlibacter sp.]